MGVPKVGTVPGRVGRSGHRPRTGRGGSVSAEAREAGDVPVVRVGVCRYACGVPEAVLSSVLGSSSEGSDLQRSSGAALRPRAQLDLLPERLRKRIEVSGKHWLWIGYVRRDGYGIFGGGEVSTLAHREVWAALGGELPEHLHHDGCPFKHCTAPGCLTPMSASDHKTLHAAAERREACKWDHPFDEANTSWRIGRNGRPSRQCRRCKAITERRRVAGMNPDEKRALTQASIDRRRHRTGMRKLAGSRY